MYHLWTGRSAGLWCKRLEGRGKSLIPTTQCNAKRIERERESESQVPRAMFTLGLFWCRVVLTSTDKVPVPKTPALDLTTQWAKERKNAKTEGKEESKTERHDERDYLLPWLLRVVSV